jgi:hypothetical protein
MVVPNKGAFKENWLFQIKELSRKNGYGNCG